MGLNLTERTECLGLCTCPGCLDLGTLICLCTQMSIQIPLPSFTLCLLLCATPHSFYVFQ